VRAFGRTKLLEVSNLNSGYGDLQVLWDVSLNISEGEFVVLLGPNGAGKTTTLRSIAGVLKPEAGGIEFMGKPIGGLSGHQINQMGISFVTEDLNLFTKMTVRDNLLVGAHTVRDKKKIRDSMDYALALFPRLEERQSQLAGTLSGGERKMLAIARGLMSDPKLLLVDEPSLGLAPLLAEATFDALQELNRQGISILLVEQHVASALGIARRAYILEHGRIVLEGAGTELLESPHVREVYLGR
jgi:branched-chain amino acid transport system ATP-binding protein